MLKFNSNFLKFLNFLAKILKFWKNLTELWYEKFEWFDPSPIEPFNSVVHRLGVHQLHRVGGEPLLEVHRLGVGAVVDLARGAEELRRDAIDYQNRDVQVHEKGRPGRQQREQMELRETLVERFDVEPYFGFSAK